MEIKLFFRRGLVFLLIFALLALACPIRQDASALTGLDDIAIIAALLASLGISLVVYGITNNGLEGLGAKLDEYGATQGMAAGEFAAGIVEHTSIRGPRILQLARAGWQALTGFINYLKTEQGGGLSVTNPIIFGGGKSITINGIQYPYIGLEYNYSPSQMIITSYTDGKQFVYDGKGTVMEIPQFNAQNRILRYNAGLSAYFYFADDNSTFFPSTRTYYYYNVGVWGVAYIPEAGRAYLLGLEGENQINFPITVRVADLSYIVVDNPQISENKEWQINDDNFDLSYLTDAVSDIYIRLGSIEGDLDTLADIAQGVVDAYDSSYAETGVGTITATATTADIGAAGDYATPSLSSFFPFCIPFDIYAMVTAFAAEPVAPVVEIPFAFTLPGQAQTLAEQNEDNKLIIDLSEFDTAAQVLRSLEYVLFCIGLALLTRKVIKW